MSSPGGASNGQQTESQHSPELMEVDELGASLWRQPRTALCGRRSFVRPVRAIQSWLWPRIRGSRKRGGLRDSTA